MLVDTTSIDVITNYRKQEIGNMANTFPSSYTTGSPEGAAAEAKDKRVAQILFGRPSRAYDAKVDLQNIPQFQQTQRALNDQLRDLQALANRLGMYDAADFLGRL